MLIFSNGVAFAEPDDEIVAFEIETRTGKDQDRPDTAVSPATSKQNKQQPEYDKPDCGKPKDAEEADLCEQARMAEAAEGLLDRTDTQIRLSRWEIGGLLATVVFTAIASLAAAWAVVISRQAISVQQRAWITVKLGVEGPLIWSRMGEPSFDVEAEIKNIGKSPALNIHTTMQVEFFGEQREAIKALAEYCRKNPSKNSRMLVPDDSYVRKWGFVINQEEITHRAPKGKMWPVVIGCVTYETLYDKRLHQTTFAHLIGDSGGDQSAANGIRIDNTNSRGLVAVVVTGGFAN